MTIKLLAFAHLQDQLGFHEKAIECTAGETARALLARVAPGLETSGVRVAVDQEYQGWDEPLGNAREVALIPPVSGG